MKTEAKYMITQKLNPQTFSADTTELEKTFSPEAAAKYSTKQLFRKAAELQGELMEAGIHSDIAHTWDESNHTVSVTVTPFEEDVIKLKKKVAL